MKRLQLAPEEADIVDLTHEAAGVAEGIDVEGHARLHGLHAGVEVVDVDLEELAVSHRGQRLGRLAG